MARKLICPAPMEHPAAHAEMDQQVRPRLQLDHQVLATAPYPGDSAPGQNLREGRGHRPAQRKTGELNPPHTLAYKAPAQLPCDRLDFRHFRHEIEDHQRTLKGPAA